MRSNLNTRRQLAVETTDEPPSGLLSPGTQPGLLGVRAHRPKRVRPRPSTPAYALVRRKQKNATKLRRIFYLSICLRLRWVQRVLQARPGVITKGRDGERNHRGLGNGADRLSGDRVARPAADRRGDAAPGRPGRPGLDPAPGPGLHRQGR